jgi:hypothetical protein
MQDLSYRREWEIAAGEDCLKMSLKISWKLLCTFAHYFSSIPWQFSVGLID